MEAGELPSPYFELVRSVLGGEESADQVLENQHQDPEQSDGLGAELDVGDGTAEREHRGGEFRR